MKKTARKVLLMACSALLLVCLTVGATVAYLTSTTDAVKNTFSVGNLAITLDETDVDLYGVATGKARDTENAYKLVPNHEYVKDPTVHLAPESEASILFVKVVDTGLAELESKAEGYVTIAEQIAAKGWKELGVENVYFKYVAANTSKTDAVDYVVFEKFTIDKDVDLSVYSGENAQALPTVNVTAYAIQADGFITKGAADVTVDQAKTAWDAAPANWKE